MLLRIFPVAIIDHLFNYIGIIQGQKLFKNISKSYGLVSILLHWLMALLIFFMFGLGLYMVELTYYDAWYKGSLDLHKSLGITLLVLWFIRLTWKSINIQPNPLPGAKWEQSIAHCMHWLL